MSMNHETENFSLLFNCKDTFISEQLSKPVSSSDVELLISQNPLEYLLPFQRPIDIKPGIKSFMDENLNDPDVRSKFEMFGFHNLEGLV